MPGKENKVRRIKLRRGLNILWAKPENSGKPARLNESGISGHTSGKTTFCRLLRHILGEKHFANELVTPAIRQKFEGGWVVGEVFISGNLWLVCRPFTLGAKPFAVQGCTLEEFLNEKAPRGSFNEYLDALEHAVLGDLPVRNFAYSGQRIQWLHLLQWLARDQECRLIQLTDWRSPLSHAESPGMSSEDQNSLVRTIIGLLDEQERQEIELNAKLNKEKESINERIPILRGQAEIDHQRLEQALGETLPEIDNRLFVESVTNKLREELKETDRLIEIHETDVELKQLQENLEQSIRATTSAESDIRALDDLLLRVRTQLETCRRQNRRQIIPNMRSQLKPGEGYCAVPIREAKNKGCKLAFEAPIDLESVRALQELENEVPRLEREIEELEAKKKQVGHLLQQRKQEEKNAKRRLYEYQTKQISKRRILYNKRTDLVNYLRLAERAYDAWHKSEELNTSLSKYEKEIKETQIRQSTLRVQHQKNLQTISAFYDEIIRAVLGNSVSGKFDLNGRYLTAKIERNGDVSSGAIDTIKILAFDLAALAASVAGHGSHPRFLLHDSPREADMASLTYQRFFLWVQKLEQSFGDNHPCSFQYIITTTEPPPEALQTEPWLLDPILDASKPESRLLGVNL
jgi:hypothetical protein